MCDSLKSCLVWLQWIVVLYLMEIVIVLLTVDKIHPTIFICENSPYVYKLMSNSKIFNSSLVSSPFLSDILWTKMHKGTVNFVKTGFVRDCQSFNHVISETTMTDKVLMTLLLREEMKKSEENRDFVSSFYPESYVLNDQEDMLAFINRLGYYLKTTETELDSCQKKEKEIWMLKPSRGSSGEGIKILTSEETARLSDLLGQILVGDHMEETYFHEEYSKLVKEFSLETYNGSYIIQKYVSNPLLIRNRKFSIRMYWMIAALDPLIVLLYPEGTANIAYMEYVTDEDQFDSIMTHITNGNKNFEDPNFPKQFNFTVLQELLYEEYPGLEKDWWEVVFFQKVKLILDFVSRSFHRTLETEEQMDSIPGGLFWGLFGIDVMIDDKFNIFLVEVQDGCGFRFFHEWKENMLLKMMEETFTIASHIQTCNKKNIFIGNEKEDIPVGNYARIV